MNVRLYGIIALALSCTAITAPAPALAQAGIVYDCDTAADHFSELILPAGSVPFTVSGKIEHLTSAASTAYVPLARLAISNAADAKGASTEGWAGFEYTIVPKAEGQRASTPLLSFTIRDKGKDNDVMPVGLPSGKEVQFALTYDGSRVNIRVDGHDGKLALSAPQPVLRIVCSTGEFRFTEVAIRPGS